MRTTLQSSGRGAWQSIGKPLAAIHSAIQLAGRKHRRDIANLKMMSGILAAEYGGKDTSFLEPFMFNNTEIMRFAAYISREKFKGLRLAEAVAPWIYGRGIREMKSRYLPVHFHKYGREVGMVLLGRIFHTPEEYSDAAIDVIRNVRNKTIMMYYFKRANPSLRKPSLGFFPATKGKCLWIPVNNGRIKSFRAIPKKRVKNQQLFKAAYILHQF